jgi:hypothetical protein
MAGLTRVRDESRARSEVAGMRERVAAAEAEAEAARHRADDAREAERRCACRRWSP